MAPNIAISQEADAVLVKVAGEVDVSNASELRDAIDAKLPETTGELVVGLADVPYIDSTGIDYFVGPFETAIEGDYDQCMEILKNCQLVGAEAGCKHVMTYAKINFKPEGDVMTTEHKVAKYHEGDPEFAPKSAGSAA